MSDDKIIKKIQELAGGAEVPISISREVGGKPKIDVAHSWREGGTEPVEDEKGNIAYQENYTDKSLTKTQINAIDEFIKSII